MFINGFFKTKDYRTNEVAGFGIHPAWWSRQYEYPWAFGFLRPNMVVADMGCGYHERPFKNMLATKCKKVYAVDNRSQTKSLKIREDNIQLVIADFAKAIPEIEPGSLDRIFCLSVLEEGVDIQSALSEFAKLLKPDGLIVVTFDAIADPSKPVGIYKGVDFDKFIHAVESANLEMAGGVDFSTQGRLLHPDWNLSVFHTILWRKDFPDKQTHHQKANDVLDWIENNILGSGGVAAHPNNFAYPEVTGYVIPTLLARGKVESARKLAGWLISTQDQKGGFRDLDENLRSFDTAACMEGLQAAGQYFGDKNYTLSYATSRDFITENTLGTEGKIFTTPQKDEFCNYSLRVNGIMGIAPDWINSYLTNWPFQGLVDRTHYLAYALEGLLTLGEEEKVKTILSNISQAILPSGLICYWVKPNWEISSPVFPCHTASAQIGLLLIRLGIKPDLVALLFENLVKAVNENGGLPARPGSVETSWTAKWFLDFEEAVFDAKVYQLLTR
jgi:precorrin-6B methylase 2